MSHTEGKLATFAPVHGMARMIIKDETGDPVASADSEANARRLVACWNALIPVETEWLEQYNTNPVIDSVFTENAKLRQERDELVKALRDLLSHPDGGTYRIRPERDPAKTAITILGKYPEQS